MKPETIQAGQDTRERLREIIERDGLSVTLAKIADICSLKAANLATRQTPEQQDAPRYGLAADEISETAKSLKEYFRL